jgi:F0F1-type ATP synthase assembly protein I
MPPFTQTGSTVIPPLAAGRRLARRCALAQFGAGAAMALIFLAISPMAAIAAGLGPVALGLGTLVLGWRAFPGRAPGASEALGGLVAGLLMKILLVGSVLLLGLGLWRLPPLPLLLGVFVGLVTFAVAAAFPASSAGPRSR